jgi:hypothetical protein
MRKIFPTRRRFLSLFAMFVVLSPLVHAQARSPLLLSNVRKIYIEKMADNLDQYLASSISSKFKGAVSVVLNKSDADAILRGVNIGAQTTVQATVELVDPSEKQVFWSGTAGDRSVVTLGMSHRGLQTIADKLIGELHKAMQR